MPPVVGLSLCFLPCFSGTFLLWVLSYLVVSLFFGNSSSGWVSWFVILVFSYFPAKHSLLHPYDDAGVAGRLFLS